MGILWPSGSTEGNFSSTEHRTKCCKSVHRLWDILSLISPIQTHNHIIIIPQLLICPFGCSEIPAVWARLCLLSVPPVCSTALVHSVSPVKSEWEWIWMFLALFEDCFSWRQIHFYSFSVASQEKNSDGELYRVCSIWLVPHFPEDKSSANQTVIIERSLKRPF